MAKMKTTTSRPPSLFDLYDVEAPAAAPAAALAAQSSTTTVSTVDVVQSTPIAIKSKQGTYFYCFGIDRKKENEIHRWIFG